MRPYLAELAAAADTLISAYPNAGLPNELGEYDEQPEETSAHLRAVPAAEQSASFVEANGIRPPSRRGGAPRSLTEVIVELELCSREQVLEAIELAAASGTTADQVLLERGAISPEGVAVALAERHGLDYVDLGIFNVDMAAAQLVTSQVAKRHDALPIATAGDRALLVAMSDPANVHADPRRRHHQRGHRERGRAPRACR